MLILVHSGDAQWECQYATWDNSANGTGHQVIGMGVIKENMFVALVTSRGVRSFMIPYVNADSGLGRKYFYGYGSAILTDVYQVWTDAGFDQVTMNNAFALKAMPDSLIYVASNDAEHNVLVFKYTADTVTVVEPFPRQVTGANSIFGIDVDNNGYVYVCTDTTTGVTADIKVYRPIGQWTPAGHQDAPITTIDLPDGMYKGIAVTANGNAIFISDYMNRKVIKYVGTPATGYTLATGFNFALGPQDTLSAVPPKNAGPIGLAHLASKNILAVAVDSLFKQATTTSYAFGRVYLLNGNTGARISTDTSMNMIDQAAWAFSVTGSYASRGDGDIPGNVSSYASTIDVKWDAQGNLYSQSYYGWTVEKWKYNGTLPSFTTAVEEMGGTIPDGFSLSQNYPNPFNPTTTIEFSLPQSGFVSLRVFDLLGQEIATLANEERPAGTYQATFDASSLPSGTYFYMLKAGAYSEVKKMVILK
jgi:hypothetical protein